MAKVRASMEAFGLQGENMMRHCLESGLNSAEYVILHDVLLPRMDGRPTQIDHIVVSRYGIFVVEMKNWVGRIKVTDGVWVKYVGRRRQRLRDPQSQNRNHVKTLSERLNIPGLYIHGLIAISDCARFADGKPDGVCFMTDVPAVICSYTTQLIKDVQIPEIVTAIREWSCTYSAWERRHFDEMVRRRIHQTEGKGMK